MTIDENFLLFNFKSEFCPFSKMNHDRFTCVYAHNWQDYKRPFFHNQKPIVCSYWNSEEEILRYEDGCPNNISCEYCHGWKEFEYHV